LVSISIALCQLIFICANIKIFWFIVISISQFVTIYYINSIILHKHKYCNKLLCTRSRPRSWNRSAIATPDSTSCIPLAIVFRLTWKVRATSVAPPLPFLGSCQRSQRFLQKTFAFLKPIRCHSDTSFAMFLVCFGKPIKTHFEGFFHPFFARYDPARIFPLFCSVILLGVPNWTNTYSLQLYFAHLTKVDVVQTPLNLLRALHDTSDLISSLT